MSATSGESLTPEFLRLQAEARRARERYQLYKARTFGPRPTDPGRLRELERTCQLAERRLRRASSHEPSACSQLNVR
jgi:hypothetical protein